MDRFKVKNTGRRRRHNTIRRKVFGTDQRPRLCVFRSNRNIYCQLVDDAAHRTVAHASTMEKEMREALLKRSNKEAAKEIGKRIAQKAVAMGIRQIHFDRAGYKYHGRIRELAEGARESGLKF